MRFAKCAHKYWIAVKIMTFFPKSMRNKPAFRKNNNIVCKTFKNTRIIRKCAYRVCACLKKFENIAIFTIPTRN